MTSTRTLLALTLLLTACTKQKPAVEHEPAPRYVSAPKYQLKTFGADLLMFRPGTGETWAFNPKTRDWIALPKPRQYTESTATNVPIPISTNRITNDTAPTKPQ